MIAHEDILLTPSSWLTQAGRYTVHSARTDIHQADLKDAKEFPSFANTFTSNVALLATENQPMAEADQVFCFRSAMKNTFFYNQTSVDSLTNQPFATLSALLHKCRALFFSSPGRLRQQEW